MEDYIKINRELWNKKTPVHIASKFYDIDGFLNGRCSLNPIELDALGDVKGRSLLHLQCHFGLDSLSWARLGAKVTGIDLSDKAIEKARELNNELGLDAEFICSDVYELDKVLDKQYDIVFTSYGTIGWLPELNKWAEIINRFLKPGGTFLIVEFHPVVWMFDDNFTRFEYSYFNAAPIVEVIKGTYADKDADINHESYGWNHPLSDIFSALLEQNLHIAEFKEYPFSFYDCFNKTVKNTEGHFQIKGLEGKLPLMYSIKAIKK